MRARKAWKCDVCGYVHEGDTPPEMCPVCGATPDMFSPLALAETHEVRADEQSSRVVVVGGGIAGLTAAENARRASAAATVTLVVRPDEGLPYYRLNLSRVLAGEASADSLVMKDAAWFASLRIELVRGEAVSIDRSNATVKLTDGAALPFDRLVLATGATPFVPPIPGAEAALVLRTRGDLDRLMQKATSGARAICIGGGLLGLEAAFGLLRRGAKVTVLESAPALLPRQLAAAGGRMVERHLASLGLAIRCGVKIQEIARDLGATSVRLLGGESLSADLVLVAAGVRADTTLARAAGLAVKSGVVIDDHTATSDPRIFAAGDVAEWRGNLYGIWPAAYAQGVVAGRNAAGADDTLAPFVPSNRLKVVSLGVFGAGEVTPADAGAVVHEVEDERTYVRMVTRDGRLVGANLVGDTGLDAVVVAALETQGLLSEIPEIVSYLGPSTRSDGVPEGLMNERERPMASIKGTQTEKNLLAAFAGESQARNRYTYFASAAKKEGLQQIADIFTETAENEKEHAKRFFKFLEGGMCEITASYPAGTIGTTAENLAAAAAGEHEEWTELYPGFAEVAKKEGFNEVAAAFTMISKVEKEHEARYLKLLALVKDGKVFKADGKTRWKCRNCGYVHEGNDAPGKCPACLHPQEYFERQATNY